MLNFHRRTKGRRPPRNYLDRREQYRLLGLVFALGLVVLLAVKASDPANWVWLTGSGHDLAASASPEAELPIDTRRQPAATVPLPLDTVRMSIPNLQAAQADDGYFPGVVSAHLRQVKDDEPFRAADAPAWLNLLSVLSRTSDDALQQASEGQVGFVQLYQQPDAYRGKVVSLKGNVRRITERPVGKNSAGLTNYYEMVLRPAGRNPRPIFVYVLQLPAGLKPGDSVDEPVELTGFFFKNRLYAGEQATYVAPVLAARTVRWTPAPAAPVFAPSLPLLAAIGAGSAVVAITLAWIVYRRTRLARIVPMRAGTEDIKASIAAMAESEGAAAPFPEYDGGASPSFQIKPH